AVADQTFELTKSEPALRRCLCSDEIGQALHRREIEPAIFKRAAGELAGFGKLTTLYPTECLEHAGNNRLAAMKLQLSDILASLATRRRKPQHQRFVDDLAIRRIAHPRQRGLARFGQTADQFFKSNAGARPGHAYHGN